MKNVRKIIISLIILCIIGIVPIYASEESSSIENSMKYAIEYVKNNGIMKGYSNTDFGENNKITNAELIVALMRSYYTGDYISVDSVNWWDSYVKTMQVEKVTIGSSLSNIISKDKQSTVKISDIADGIVGILGVNPYSYNFYDNYLNGLESVLDKQTANNIELLHQLGIIEQIDLEKEYTRGELANILYQIKTKFGTSKEIPKPKSIENLKVVYLDDRAKVYEKSCMDAISGIPKNILKDFIDAGWTFKFTTENIWNYYKSDYFKDNIGISGLCAADTKEIYVSFKIKYNIESSLLHEMGHFVKYHYFNLVNDVKLNEIYKSEKEAMIEHNREYSGSTVDEFFADGFMKTVIYLDREESNYHPKTYIPQLNEYILDIFNKINEK